MKKLIAVLMALVLVLAFASCKNDPKPTPTPTQSENQPTPTPTPSASASASGEATPTPTPSASGEATPTPTPSASGEATPTPTPEDPTEKSAKEVYDMATAYLAQLSEFKVKSSVKSTKVEGENTTSMDMELNLAVKDFGKDTVAAKGTMAGSVALNLVYANGVLYTKDASGNKVKQTVPFTDVLNLKLLDFEDFANKKVTAGKDGFILTLSEMSASNFIAKVLGFTSDMEGYKELMKNLTVDMSEFQVTLSVNALGELTSVSVSGVKYKMFTAEDAFYTMDTSSTVELEKATVEAITAPSDAADYTEQ